ncbi:MAG: nucleotidyltransferase substrate binding protein [Epsilonproteobacteria bacterium]|nr:nucleotidyltransferase substrate binding protein [Campylobacterota bacterium]
MGNYIRWQQRFSNYQKAFKQLKSAVELFHQRELSLLERQGVVQAFEYTHELAWKTMKDFLEYRGSTEQIYGSKDATRQAFSFGLIDYADVWMRMIQSRNLTSHIYDEAMVADIVDEILSNYFFRFEELKIKFSKILEDENQML